MWIDTFNIKTVSCVPWEGIPTNIRNSSFAFYSMRISFKCVDNPKTCSFDSYPVLNSDSPKKLFPAILLLINNPTNVCFLFLRTQRWTLERMWPFSQWASRMLRLHKSSLNSTFPPASNSKQPTSIYTFELFLFVVKSLNVYMVTVFCVCHLWHHNRRTATFIKFI